MTVLALDRDQKIRLKNTLLAALAAAFLSLALVYAQWAGQMLISESLFWRCLIVLWLINFSIIGLLVSGFNLRFADPSLSLLQMYWATTCSILSLVVTTDLDALYLLFVMLTMVFGIFRVPVEQFILYCIYMVVASLIAIVARHYYLSVSEGLVNELIVWAAFSFCAAMLTTICASIVKLRLRLREKNAELEHALEAKSRFLANMSHEIRTPMNGVLGMLELSLTEEMDSNLHKQLSIAHTSANALLSVINDILDYSKIEAGKLTIEEHEFDFHALLDSTLQSFHSRIYEKGLDCKIQFSGSVIRQVKSDEGRLRQVLNNLIGNAIKFTNTGSIDIQVSSNELNNGKYQLTVSIKDTGIGIEPEKLKGLFDSFTQADASTTRIYGGTGLGLAIAKDLCELMGGGILPKSKMGVGSEFVFWVVVEGLADMHHASIESSGDTPAPKACSLAGKRVLIVEDNPTNQDVIVLVAEAMNIEADIASHGGEAIALLENALADNESYDAILMDCQMPVLDGYQTTKVIREQASLATFKDLPIIAMTANAMEGDREKCLAAGMNDYLTKPVDFALLQATLCEWLEGGRGIPSTATPQEQGSPQVTTHTNAETVWDRDELLNAVGGRPDRVARLVTRFLDDLSLFANTICDAVAQHNSEELQQTAHSLKGAAANLRLKLLASYAGKIEQYGRENDWENASKVLPELLNAVVQAREKLEENNVDN